jgi:hypothetical protein
MSGDRNSMLRRVCSVFLVAAVPALVTIASCSGGQPDAAGNGLAPEGGPVVCSIGVEGCPCESPGQAVDCGKIKSQQGDYVTCSIGRSQCVAGKWSSCEGDRIVTKSLNVNLSAGGLHTLAHSVPCTNVCDPNDCKSVASDLTDVVATGISPQDGGIGLTLGDSGAPACAGLQCAVASCGGNPNSTTITGIVRDPAGVNPLYGIDVFVPVDATGALPAHLPGASTAACGGAGAIVAVTATKTAADGSFTLTGVPSGTGIPAGNGIPLVMQSGKWRREIMLTSVASCTANTVGTGGGQTGCKAPISAADCKTRLPRNKTDGWNWTNGTYSYADLPKIALISGNADPFECLLLKIGIDPNEFGSTTLNATRSVHEFESPDRAATLLAPAFGNRVKGNLLYNSNPSILPNYDVVVLPCEGAALDKSNAVAGVNKSTVAPPAGVNPYKSLINYTDNGGRAFATHYSYVWIDYPSKSGIAAPNNWSTVATWIHPTDSSYVPTDPLPTTVNSAFTNGAAFQSWLSNVGASAVPGELLISQPRHDHSTIGTYATRWLTAIDDTSGANPQAYPPLFTFETPYRTAGAITTYGRTVFSDFHVSSDALVSGGSSCVTNADCGYGQTCAGAGSGFPGSCNESCTSPASCGNSTYSCSASGGGCKPKACQDDKDCPAGSGGCNNNKCGCGKNSDCGSGVCSGGSCTAHACSNSGDCGKAESCGGGGSGACSKACTVQADCSAGKELCMSAVNTTTSASFVQPAAGATVVVTVAATTNISVNQQLYVLGGGIYTVTAVDTVTKKVTLQNSGASNTAAGATIATNKKVSGLCNGGACTCSGCFSGADCTSGLATPTCSGATVTTGTCTPAAPAAPGGGFGVAAGWFPYVCAQSPMLAQEKALEFMFFDLTSCVASSTPPPPPPTYAAVTFTQDYTATCRPDQRVIWREFDWQSVVPATSSIDFSAQSGPDAAGLLPATPVALASATASTALLGWDVALIDTSNGLGGAGTGAFNTAVPPVRSDKLLRVTINMKPTSNKYGTPLLLQWKVQYDCVAAE